MPWNPTANQGPGPNEVNHQLGATDLYQVSPSTGWGYRICFNPGATPFWGRHGSIFKGGLKQGYWHRAISNAIPGEDITGFTPAQVLAKIQEINSQIDNETYATIPWEWTRSVKPSGGEWVPYYDPPADPHTSDWLTSGPVYYSYVWISSGALYFRGTQFSVNRGSFINIKADVTPVGGIANTTSQTLVDSGELDGTPKRILLPEVGIAMEWPNEAIWCHMVFFDMSWQQYQDAFMTRLAPPKRRSPFTGPFAGPRIRKRLNWK